MGHSYSIFFLFYTFKFHFSPFVQDYFLDRELKEGRNGDFDYVWDRLDALASTATPQEAAQMNSELNLLGKHFPVCFTADGGAINAELAAINPLEDAWTQPEAPKQDTCEILYPR